MYGWIVSLYLTQAVNKQKNKLVNIIYLMYIKNMIHDKDRRKTKVIGINILIKTNNKDESLRANLAHLNFFHILHGHRG